MIAFAAELDEEHRDFFVKRRAILRVNFDLREREGFKEALLTEALGARGLQMPTDRLAAQIGMLALGAAYEDWVLPHVQVPLTDLTAIAIRELSSADAALCASEPSGRLPELMAFQDDR